MVKIFSVFLGSKRGCKVSFKQAIEHAILLWLNHRA